VGVRVADAPGDREPAALGVAVAERDEDDVTDGVDVADEPGLGGTRVADAVGDGGDDGDGTADSSAATSTGTTACDVRFALPRTVTTSSNGNNTDASPAYAEALPASTDVHEPAAGTYPRTGGGSGNPAGGPSDPTAGVSDTDTDARVMDVPAPVGSSSSDTAKYVPGAAHGA
jgi:hypothetical protein